MFEFSDGGKESAGINESKDCVVRAFSIVSGIDYVKVHEICKSFGRKDGHRFQNFKKSAQPIAKALGLAMKQICRSGSLAKLLKNYPLGTLFIQMRGHVFAVIDGVIKDTWQASEHVHIRGAWIVTKKVTAVNEA